MREGLCNRLHRSITTRRKGFFWRLFFFVELILIALALGLAFAFFEILELPESACLDLFLGFIGSAVLIGLVLVLMLRALIIKELGAGIEKLEAVSGSFGQQARKMGLRLQLEELLTRLIEIFSERRLALLDQEKDYLTARARYGWFLPPEQVELIFKDESETALRAKARDEVQLYLLTRGLSQALLQAERIKPGDFLKKHYQLTQALARASGMVLASYSVESSLLVAGVPFPVAKLKRKRWFNPAQKWLKALNTLFEEAGLEGLAPISCYHFGRVGWSSVISGSRRGFLIDPSERHEILARVRGQELGGVLVTEDFSARLGLNEAELDPAIRVLGKDGESEA